MPARPRAVANHAQRYGPHHRALREQWAHIVNAGDAICWRCREPINPGQPWDLGHDDNDHTTHRGPEHEHCNRAAAARKTNKQRRDKQTQRPRSQPW